jgi:long-subunit acyl-CoA synthetase (AMP-forming)
MQEFTTPPLVEVDPAENLTTLAWEHERTHPTRAALAYRQGDAFVDVSTAEFAARVRRLAAGFIGLGIEPGSRICLFSPTRLEFTLFAYAIWAAGCATVTIYETSSASQVAWVVEHSAAVAIVCATTALLEVYEEQAGMLGTCAHTLSVDRLPGSPSASPTTVRYWRRALVSSRGTGKIRRRPPRPSTLTDGSTLVTWVYWTTGGFCGSPVARRSSSSPPAANASVSKAESIRQFRILPVDFTIEGGELTPTLKVKRRIVSERFANAIASIYGD